MMEVIRMNIEHFSLDRFKRGTKQSCQLTIVHRSSDGTQTETDLPVFVLTGLQQGPVLLVLAGVHGDEYEGMQTVLKLFHDLTADQLRGRLVMIPTANPLAYRGKTRESPEDGLNLARVFPGKLAGSMTERLAYELHHRFIASADFLLDLHSGGVHYEIALLTGYYHNESSELGRRSRAAAEAFGIPLLWGHETTAPGRSISSAQMLGIPWLYTEASGGGRVRPEEAVHYYEGTLRLMHHLGMLQEIEANALPAGAAEFQTIYGEGNFDQSAISEHDGFFIPAVALKSRVQKGDPIGAIFDFTGAAVQQVHADRDGIVVMLAGRPAVSIGDPLYMIASEANIN